MATIPNIISRLPVIEQETVRHSLGMLYGSGFFQFLKISEEEDMLNRLRTVTQEEGGRAKLFDEMVRFTSREQLIDDLIRESKQC